MFDENLEILEKVFLRAVFRLIYSKVKLGLQFGMEQCPRIPLHQVSSKLLPQHNNRCVVSGRPRTAPYCLDNSRHDAVVKQNKSCHPIHEETFVKICCTRQTFDD